MLQEAETKINNPIDTFVVPRGTKQIIREIIAEEAKKAKLKPSDIIGQSRTGPVVAARHIAMYRIRKETTYSYPRIGAIFNRDHTTVIHAFQKIKAIRGE